MSVSTCSGPVVGRLVWSAVDETSQAGDSMRPHQDVTAKRPAVHHPDVERRVEKLILWKVLRTKLRITEVAQQGTMREEHYSVSYTC